MTVEVLTPAEEVELFVNGKSVGRQKTGEEHQAIAVFETVYEPGEILAVDSNGEKFCIQTAGAEVQLGVTPTGELTEITQEDFDFAFERNIRGAMFGCKAAVKVMEEQGYGSIVLVGSAHGLGGGEIDRVIYGATKGALLTLMKHISNRYADKGIRANYITMGWVATESEIELRKSQNHPDDWLEKTGAEEIPLGRLVTVEDMVPGIVYLLGYESQMVTGTALHITGGMTYI